MEFANLHWQLEALRSFQRPWFVAGGWAIDLFLGHQSRDHQDIDIAIFREDQFEPRRHLSNWKWEKVVNGTPVGWESGEWLELPVHEVRASRGEYQLEFLFNERRGDLWEYRRDRTIVEGREVFRCVIDLPRHHLYVCEESSRPVFERRSFRDRLRNDSEMASTYARLKGDLAQQFRTDRKRYTEGKTDFIRGILRSTSRIPP